MKRKFHIDFNNLQDHALDYLLGILVDTRLTTLQRVKDLTISELHWQYKDGWNTIGALLSHMSALEHYFRIEYVEEKKLTEEENTRWEPALDMGKHLPELIGDRPIEEYLIDLTESREMLLTSLETITFEEFEKRREGYDIEAGCNLAWVLYHMAEDEIYHRGQISILQKLFKENF